jgi:cob(I)alamin adenosyltransferase
MRLLRPSRGSCRNAEERKVMSEQEVWITTRGGDKGTTSLGDGTRVDKDHPRVELYGTIDECQAALGLARATACSAELSQAILELETDLYGVMGYLALYPGQKKPEAEKLDAIVSRVKTIVGTRFQFVRPGDSTSGAALHMARTIARRAERTAVGLFREKALDDGSYTYINRLSDAIYALSLWTDHVCRSQAIGDASHG